MAFLCPVRIGRKKKKHGHLESDLLSGTLSRQLPQMGRITGSASIETLVRVGIEKEHGLSPDSKMIVLHDFTPCVDDELEVARGQIVNVLYQENDWVYVISESQQHEGFIPFSYCTPYEAPLENILQFKKKMPRSGPGSVVSGSGFNEMAVDPGPNDPDNALKMVSNGGSSVDTFRAVNYVNNKSSTCPTASGATSVVSEGAKCYLVDGITSADKDALTLPIKSSPNSEFGTQYRAANQYSPGLSMPMSDSISQKQQHQSYHNSMLNIDNVSTTQNLTNLHTATGPSTAAPSIVSACSNGGRSNLSSNPNSNAINNNKPNLLLKPSNGVGGVGLLNPMNDAANHGYGGGSAYPNDSLVRKMDYFSQVQPTLQDSIVSPTNSQIGEMYPFFKDQVGRFIVLFSFLARDENELSVERGEVVNVLNKEDQDWYWVARSDSQEGFVPALYICPAEMLLNAHNASLVLNQMRQSNLNSSNTNSQVAHHLQQQQPNPYGEPNNMLNNTHIITTMPNNHNAPNGYQFNSSGPGMPNQNQNGGIQNGLPLNGINFTQPAMPLRLHHVPPPITG